MNLWVCILFVFYFSCFFETFFGSFINADFQKSVILAIVTHKGAAADSGHYIGFVKKSVFYEAKAKARELNTSSTHTALAHDLNTTLDELRSAHSPDPTGNVAAASDPALMSIANPIIRTGFDPVASGSAITEHPANSNPAPNSGPSTFSTLGVALDSEDDEDWYKFDDDKVTDFPKEKLPTLEGGGEDSSAYVLVYRSKVL
jgi:ubiquitin carboxyl-terminal hydrolase 14